mmetsp:Transcript_2692/g.5643  ORF Transcript_2692/g.5643 Transcript_2692/m.5643 type:complete len:201 (-) Transcript_2692:1664-2266(-)
MRPPSSCSSASIWASFSSSSNGFSLTRGRNPIELPESIPGGTAAPVGTIKPGDSNVGRDTERFEALEGKNDPPPPPVSGDKKKEWSSSLFVSDGGRHNPGGGRIAGLRGDDEDDVLDGAKGGVCGFKSEKKLGGPRSSAAGFVDTTRCPSGRVFSELGRGPRAGVETGVEGPVGSKACVETTVSFRATGLFGFRWELCWC